MKKLEKRTFLNQVIAISVIALACLFILGIGIELLTNKSYSVSIVSIGNIIKTTPQLWIIGLLLLIVPVGIYFISNILFSYISSGDNELKTIKSSLVDVSKFIDNLINNSFDSQVKTTDKKDVIFTKLASLHDEMKLNKEIVDKQRKEDELRNWHAEGLAKFGEILRENSSDMHTLAYNVIKELTNYVGAIQSGFYLVEEKSGEKYFDLVAYYAYGRKKYADKQTPWDYGLLGTCATEKKTIHMKNVPHSYVTVTSGLGKANPSNLILCPIINETDFFGAIEIASLNELDENHKLFIEKVCESVSSTISTVRMNMRTSLLLEETKEQANALLSQEEEMRQNMEELQATQEEAGRQAVRFMRLETTVNHTMIRAEYGVDGTLNYANTKFLRKLEYSGNQEVEGKPITMFLSEKDREWFKRIWDGLSKGGRHFEGYMKHVTKSGKDLWTIATYTCMRNDEGEVDCILFLAIDSTAQKEISLKMEGVVDAVNRSNIRIEFETNGNISDYNDSFLYNLKFNEKETQNLNISDLIDSRELEDFNTKWENIVNGMNFQGQFKVITGTKEIKWIRGAYSAVLDMYGEVQKIIFIGQDITNEKLMEIEFKQQNEVLKKQETQLRQSEKDLSSKLREAKQEMQEQFKQIEKIKLRNERTLEGALDTIITTSNLNKILFYNNAAEELLGYTKEEVIGNDISMLFPGDISDEDEFTKSYTGNSDKMVGVRKEITMKSKFDEEVNVLILLSKAEVEDEITYTAFIQTIEVELF